jgi:competence protein ComEC
MILFLKQNPFFRVLLFLIPGVYLGTSAVFHYWLTGTTVISFIVLFVLLWCVIFLRSYHQQFRYRWVSGVLLGMVIFLSGINLSQMRKTPISRISGDYHFKGVTQEILGHNDYSIKAKVKLLGIDCQDGLITKPMSGIFYFSVRPNTKALSLGDTITGFGHLSGFEQPIIPYQFDNGQYLNRKGYSFQLKVKTFDVLGHGQLSFIQKLRSRFIQVYKKGLESKESQGVVQALVLGDKSDLSSDLRQSYVKAGAIHILAVSGMHVGILFLMLSYLFSFLNRIKVLKLVLILAVLWLYAWLTGFSPSVLRSTIMFSVIVLGKEMGEKSSLYNLLSFSAFLIFIIDPFSIYDAGFWLSHLAVLGMGLFYQRIYNLIGFQFIVWRWIWSMVAVSIAAQITTFPIILWLFNGFPVYFLLANVLVLPIIPVVLGGSLLILCFPANSLVANVLGSFISELVEIMDQIILWVAHLPGAYWSNVSFSGIEVFLFFAGLLFLFICYASKRIRYLMLATVSVCLLIASLTIRIYSANHQSVIYASSTWGKGVVNILDGRHNLVILSRKSAPSDAEFLFTAMWGRHFALKPRYVYADSVSSENWQLKYGDKQLLWINRLTNNQLNMHDLNQYDWIVWNGGEVLDKMIMPDSIKGKLISIKPLREDTDAVLLTKLGDTTSRASCLGEEE